MASFHSLCFNWFIFYLILSIVLFQIVFCFFSTLLSLNLNSVSNCCSIIMLFRRSIRKRRKRKSILKISVVYQIPFNDSTQSAIDANYRYIGSIKGSESIYPRIAEIIEYFIHPIWYLWQHEFRGFEANAEDRISGRLLATAVSWTARVWSILPSAEKCLHSIQKYIT